MRMEQTIWGRRVWRWRMKRGRTEGSRLERAWREEVGMPADCEEGGDFARGCDGDDVGVEAEVLEAGGEVGEEEGAAAAVEVGDEEGEAHE